MKQFRFENNDHSFIQTLLRNRRRLRDEISDFNKTESDVHFDPSKLVAGIVAFTDEHSEQLEENEDCYEQQEAQVENLEDGNYKYSTEEENNEIKDIDSCFEHYLKQMSHLTEIVYKNSALFEDIIVPQLYQSKTVTYNNSNNKNTTKEVLPASSSSLLSKAPQEQVLDQIQHGGTGEERPQDIKAVQNYVEAKPKVVDKIVMEHVAKEEAALSDVESEDLMTCSEKTVDLAQQIPEVERLVRSTSAHASGRAKTSEYSEFTLSMIRKVAEKDVKNTIMMSTPNKELFTATIVVSFTGDKVDELTGTTAISFGWSQEEAIVNALEMFRQKEMKRRMGSLSQSTSRCASRADLTDL